MSRLEIALRHAIEILTADQRHFALVGGLAVSARSEPRFTRDVDLALAVRDNTEAEAVAFAFVQQGYVIAATVEQDAQGRLATARLMSSGDRKGIVIDCLFASSGIEADIVGMAQPLEVFPDLTLPVAQTGHLIAMKLLARDDKIRPQDALDLRALLTTSDNEDLALARIAVEQIETRGFARGRNLQRLLASLIQDR